MLNHNYRCPSHSPETASFWELKTHLFSNQVVYTDDQYENSDNPIIIQSTQRSNTLDNKKNCSNQYGCFGITGKCKANMFKQHS